MHHQADPRRHAVLPQELRPRHLRLRRHGDQRRRAARLQNPRSGRRQRGKRGGDVRAAQIPARAAGSHGGLRPILRDLSRSQTLPVPERAGHTKANDPDARGSEPLRRPDEMHSLRLVPFGLPGRSEGNRLHLGRRRSCRRRRFVFDSRDQGIEPRLDVLDRPDGVWPCESLMECTRVCPRGIKVTKNINLTKREIKTFKGEKP